MNQQITYTAEPSGNSSWLVLAVSCCGLFVLVGWSLLNTPVLMPESLFSRTTTVEAQDINENVATAVQPSQSASIVSEKLVSASSDSLPVGKIDRSESLLGENDDRLPLSESNVQDNPIVNAPTVSSLSVGVESELVREPESAFERMRREALESITAMASSVSFESASDSLNLQATTNLDKIFELLFLYAESDVFVSVGSADLASGTENKQLSTARNKAIVSYLIERGIDESRFTTQIESGLSLANGSHVVSIRAEAFNE